MSHIPEDRHKYGLVLDYPLDYNIVLQRYYEPEFVSGNGFLKQKNIRTYAEKLIQQYDVRSGQGAGTITRSMVELVPMKQTREFPSAVVTEKQKASIQNGHPWVYADEILSLSAESIANGSLVDVLSRKGQYLGTGLYSEHSQIRIRILDANANEKFGESFFARRVKYAVDYRALVMGGILQDTLVQQRPMNAVTFVDNHDTQPGQALQSFVDGWFKPLAYALILLRQDGLPCVFYGDLYGIPHDDIPPVDGLRRLIKLREAYAYGSQTDYLDDHAPPD